jgi:hypothetical protein
MNIPVPVESSGVIVFGAWGCECRGEFIMITGSETMNTQMAWKKQNWEFINFLKNL